MLFSFVGGSGHFEPLVPIAHAAMQAGHEIRFSCAPGMLQRVRARGFDAVATTADTQQPDHQDSRDGTQGAQGTGGPGASATSAPAERKPLLAVDMDREFRVLRDRFADEIAARRCKGVTRVAQSWHPDVIVCDEVDFGAMLAAESADVPCAVVVVIAAGGFIRPDVVAPPLDRLRSLLGLPPDPDLGMLRGELLLSPVPPSFRDPADPLPAGALPVRPTTLPAPGGHRPPSWAAELGDGQPVVYLTLGTIFPAESGDLLRRLVDGLKRLDATIVVTVGPDLDPVELGPQPDHVHVERYVAQSLILPHATAVVSHGGSGSVLGALAHGVPMLVVPMGADQPLNAARCEALGVGCVLDAVRTTPDEVADAAGRLLQDPSYREAAQRIQLEIEQMPTPDVAVPALEELARRRR